MFRERTLPSTVKLPTKKKKEKLKKNEKNKETPAETLNKLWKNSW